MISPEHTLDESFQYLEAMVAGVVWTLPMEFMLCYSGPIAHRSKTAAHTIRAVFQEQLADYWSRDKRLSIVEHGKVKAAKKSARFRFDVRQQERGEKVGGRVEDRYFYHEVNGIKFVPLVTTYRYLRCEVIIRIHRFEGDFHRGAIIQHNGDLDNKCKVLMDALRMPFEKNDCPTGLSHKGLFFCVLEDDRLITRVVFETRNKLGPRPPKDQLSDVDVEIDVKIYPVFPLGTMNYEFLFP